MPCILEMPRVAGDDIQYKLEEINSFLAIRYRMDHPKRERDWRTYEQEFSTRIKTAMKDLDPLIQEAVSTIHIIHGPGHPHSLSLDHRVKLLLIKQLVGESNRMFANMLDIFSMLSGINVSYKTVTLGQKSSLFVFFNYKIGLLSQEFLWAIHLCSRSEFCYDSFHIGLNVPYRNLIRLNNLDLFHKYIYILSIYYTFVITQSEYETFRDNINALIQEYREKFSVPMITDSKEYEATYRKRLLGMSMELRSMIDHASSIAINEFGRPSLLDAKEKAFIILVKEIMKLSNRRMAYELPAVWN